MKIQQVRQHYDIVIVGGGLVGASFASALAAQLRGTGSSILVIEAAPTLQVSASFDVRSTALSHGSQRLYEQLGLWPAIASHATPIRRIHVSDRGRFGVVRLDSAQMQVDALGHVAENQPLGQVLTRALEEDPDIDLLSPASVSALTPLPRGMRLQGQGVAGALPAIETDLVVLADGGRSSLLDQLGIGCSQTPYGQHALIANVAFTEPHRHVAYERFTDTGPMAVLPLADDDEARARGALIWTLPDAEAQAVAELPEREFLSRLQERFGYRLGRFDKVGARQCIL